MNKIDRKTFEDLIRITRKYYRTGDVDILDRRTKDCDLLSNNIEARWDVFENLSNAFVKLKTTDETIEEVMKLLGFELID